jgi:micrococcal nuclease
MRNKYIFSLVVSFLILFPLGLLFSEGFIIVEVIDVDRLLLTTGEEVEFLGIYIPPLSKKFKEEVIAEIRKLVGTGSLKLEFDSTPKAPSGKLSAYIYADNIFANAELVRRGYAFLLPRFEKLKYGKYLVELENQAKAGKRGLWNEDYWMTEPCGCD